FGEIGRICRDGAHIEFWSPYAFTNDGFLYGHVHGITEATWSHIGLSHRGIYAAMLGGCWQLQRFVYVIDHAVIDALNRHDFSLDFAVRYFKGVVHEFGVEIEFRRDPNTPAVVPEVCFARSRHGPRELLAKQPPVADPSTAERLRGGVTRTVRK